MKLLAAIDNGAEEKEIKEKTIQLMASLFPERLDKQKTPPLWLQFIAEKVEENCHENFMVQDLAETADVHPVYLARAFRKHFGCTVKEYQHRQRLRRSLGQLAGREATLAHMAYDFGYADQAHFSRIFKREAGLSPGQFRKLLRKIG